MQRSLNFIRFKGENGISNVYTFLTVISNPSLTDTHNNQNQNMDLAFLDLTSFSLILLMIICQSKYKTKSITSNVLLQKKEACFLTSVYSIWIRIQLFSIQFTLSKVMLNLFTIFWINQSIASWLEDFDEITLYFQMAL